MIKQFVCVIVTSSLLLAGCELGGSNTSEFEKADRTFWGQNTSTGEYYPVEAVLLAGGREGDACIVYGELSAAINNRVTRTTAELIKGEFNQHIYGPITTAFGSYEDIDGNGKLILLLLDIQDDYKPNTGSSYIAGYFNPIDTFSKQSYSRSNEADMIYLDIDPGSAGSAEFYSTIAHEFQHLINFSVHNKNKIIPDVQDLWIDEGLASAAEYIYNRERGRGHVQMKIDFFNKEKDYVKYASAISKGNNFFTWVEDENLYDEYATVYLFFQWLRIHAKNGVGIYKDIITAKDLDLKAVTGAAAKHIDPTFGDWETLLGTWLLANYVNAPSGTLGYKQEITTKPVTINDKALVLSPGEGVFSGFGGGVTFSGPTAAEKGVSPHIKYIKIGTDGKTTPINDDGQNTGGTSGDRLLTFSVNTSHRRYTEMPARITGSETGRLTGVKAAGAEPVEPARTATPGLKPLPVDVRIRF
jgi:hypothetical protein